jgi:hypothetical protein
MGRAMRRCSTRRSIQSLIDTGVSNIPVRLVCETMTDQLRIGPLWERWMVSDRMQWHIAKVHTTLSLVIPCPPELTYLNIGCPSLGINAHILPLHTQFPARPITHRRG